MKEASYAHPNCIYVIKHTVKLEMLLQKKSEKVLFFYFNKYFKM